MADETKYISKVVYGGKTLIDLTADTIAANVVLSGYTFHDKTGAPVTGTSTLNVDARDATAAAGEILATKTAYVGDTKLTGTMANNGGVTAYISTINDGAYTIPVGFHDGSGTVDIAAAEKEKITAANIRQGITILGVQGTMTGTEDVVAGSPTVTPTTSQQVITPNTENGENYLAQVTVNAIPYTETDNSAGGVTVTIASAA